MVVGLSHQVLEVVLDAAGGPWPEAMFTVKLSAFSQAGIPFCRGLRLRRYQWLQALDWL